jgi:hypothetical protein
VFVNARRERELGAENHKTEPDGSVSGAPHKTAVGGNRKRWWGG